MFLCWFFHKWSKWHNFDPYGINAMYRYQFKTCIKCNKRTERILRF